MTAQAPRSAPQRLPRRPRRRAPARQGRRARAMSAGELRQVVAFRRPAARRARPARRAGPREALFGELVTVYDERDGWAWVQLDARRLRRLPARGGAVRAGAGSRRIGCSALGTFLYPAADIKAPPWLHAQHERSSLAWRRRGRRSPGSRTAASCPRATSPSATASRPTSSPSPSASSACPTLWGGKTRLGRRLLRAGAGRHAGRRPRLPARQRHAAGRARQRRRRQRASSTGCSAAISCSGRATSAS